jgi:hypothetical protein
MGPGAAAGRQRRNNGGRSGVGCCPRVTEIIDRIRVPMPMRAPMATSAASSAPEAGTQRLWQPRRASRESYGVLGGGCRAACGTGRADLFPFRARAMSTPEPDTARYAVRTAMATGASCSVPIWSKTVAHALSSAGPDPSGPAGVHRAAQDRGRGPARNERPGCPARNSGWGRTRYLLSAIAKTGSVTARRSSSRLRVIAELMRARWVKACGKLPSCPPVESISSENMPRWLP